MTDNTDYRLYLESKFEGLAKHINAQFDNIHDKLDSLEKKSDRIETQTTRTNGRVTKLENEVHSELPHTKDGCPQRDVINEMHTFVVAEKTLKQNKKEVEFRSNSDKVRLIMVAGIVISVLLGILNNFKTQKNSTSLHGLKTEVEVVMDSLNTK